MDGGANLSGRFIAVKSGWLLQVALVGLFVLSISPPVRAQVKYARILAQRILPGGRLEVSKKRNFFDLSLSDVPEHVPPKCVHVHSCIFIRFYERLDSSASRSCRTSSL